MLLLLMMMMMTSVTLMIEKMTVRRRKTVLVINYAVLLQIVMEFIMVIEIAQFYHVKFEIQ